MKQSKLIIALISGQLQIDQSIITGELWISVIPLSSLLLCHGYFNIDSTFI